MSAVPPPADPPVPAAPAAESKPAKPRGARMNLARVISLGALAGLIAFLGVTFYKVVAPFLLPLFLAAVVAVLCRPWYMRTAPETEPPQSFGGRGR